MYILYKHINIPIFKQTIAVHSSSPHGCGHTSMASITGYGLSFPKAIHHIWIQQERLAIVRKCSFSLYSLKQQCLHSKVQKKNIEIRRTKVTRLWPQQRPSNQSSGAEETQLFSWLPDGYQLCFQGLCMLSMHYLHTQHFHPTFLTGLIMHFISKVISNVTHCINQALQFIFFPTFLS